MEDYSETSFGTFLGWMVVLAIVNILSYALDWPFWVY